MSDPACPDEEPTRPTWACATCVPPSPTRTWTRADQGFATCSPCYDRIRERLKEVAFRFVQLDPRPGGTGEAGSRGAPGFVSRPPLNLHIVSMRDHRSSQDSKVWVAGDGRVHAEDAHPPIGVWAALNTVGWAIAEHRGVNGPADGDDVYELLRWIDRHVDHITRHAQLVTELDTTLRELLAQLRPVTGDSRKRIGICPNTLDQGDTSRLCEAPLFAPVNGSDVIRCGACGRYWERSEWLHLGDLLNSAPRED